MYYNRTHHITTMLVAMGAMLLSSCLPRTVIYSYQPISEGWRATDTVHFHIDSVPANDIYAFTVGVRYTDRYPKSDLWLAMRRHTPTTTRIDTIHMQLYDDKPRLMENGVVLHEQETIVRAYRLAKGQPVDVDIYSLMRDSVLEGITDVGLHVE